MELDTEKIKKLYKNIIVWYPFKEGSNILEINPCKEITEELNQKKLKVVEIKDISKDQLQEKFDYILINSIEEYNTNLEDYIKFAKNNIKSDGTILFTVDNKFSLQSFNINDCEETKIKKCISKKEIEKTLQENGIKEYKFYYPLPNYKITNAIFTDEFLPSSENIMRDLNLYKEAEIQSFEEREKYKEIIKEDKELFKFFANSYFVEITNKNNEIKFVSFSNSRKEQYRIMTIMGNEYVYKQNLEDIGKEHLQNIKKNIEILKDLNIDVLDKCENDKIYSKIIKDTNTLDKVIINNIEMNNTEKANEIIQKFILEIKEKLTKENKIEGENIFEKYNIEIDNNINNKLTYIKYGIYDLIFQNCFYLENKFYFYDQEWRETNLPIEFIIYRAIYYLANSSNSIDREKLYSEFKLTEYIEYFEKLEKYLQEQIKDQEIWKTHAENNITVKNIYDTKNHYINLKNQADEELKGHKNEIEYLRNNLIKAQEELNYMKNSISWKSTKILRKIRGKMKG